MRDDAQNQVLPKNQKQYCSKLYIPQPIVKKKIPQKLRRFKASGTIELLFYQTDARNCFFQFYYQRKNERRLNAYLRIRDEK
jgi:hypothetical protein